MSDTRTVLITGAGGFIGQHLVRHWQKQGARVIAAGRAHSLSQNSPPPSDYIFHCAGPGSPESFSRHPSRSAAEEKRSLESVFSYMTRVAPKARLVFVSSGSVYGNASVLPTPESSPLQPLSPYARSKVLAEEQCRQLAAKGFSVSIARLFSAYGPGLRKQLLWDACHKIQEGQFEFSGTGEESRDWLHIEDAVKLLEIAVLRADPSCPVVNGGTGEAVSVASALSALCQALSPLNTPHFSGVASPEQPTHLFADTTRAKEWGFQATKLWQVGFLEYAQWFREISPDVLPRSA